MRSLPTVVLLVVALSARTISAQCLAQDDNIQHTKADNPLSRNRLYKGESIFTLKLLEAINTATPTENVFFSPYSLYHVLLLAYFGARAETEKMLRNGLELHWTEDKPVVWQAYNIGKKSLAARFSQSGDIQFTSVDKLFFGKQVAIRDCMEDKFFEEIEKLDFEKDADGQRLYINNWVENVTYGEIKDLLIPGSITKQTKLAIANAAYFKGTWQTEFKPEQTKKEIFYVSSERQEFVDMMHVLGTFSHAANEKLGCHVLEMPYKGQDESTRISMFVFLPPAVPNSLEQLLARLTSDTGILSEIVNEGIPRMVDVKFPKFNIEKTVELKPVLERLGLGKMFENGADFTAFSEKEQIGFDEILQKSKIEVNEKGSTAASSTVLFSFRSSRPVEPAMFHCNHPFVFLIYDYGTQAVLFNGVYRQPE
ncbi:AAEL008364-PA [Aedes aegypti]|nr:serine protease inhibitor 88Ea isoform X2 [Aedes aegypti]EAT39866.1 AAEL008364-PA [Aedes aegypti]